LGFLGSTTPELSVTHYSQSHFDCSKSSSLFLPKVEFELLHQPEFSGSTRSFCLDSFSTSYSKVLKDSAAETSNN
jgi:hypothetical protein